MEWTTIIVALISALIPSGLIGIFTIREQRKNAKLENDAKEIENQDKTQEVHLKLINELQDQIENLNERIDKKDARITELEDSNAELRHKLDESNTNYVKANLLKCSKLACIDRLPPLGFTELTPEEMLRERKKMIPEVVE